MNKFDKNRRRVKYCPCGKSNRNGKFVPYIGQELFGFCHSCFKTFNSTLNEVIEPIVKEPKITSYISEEIFKQSLKNRKGNKFYLFISHKLSVEHANIIFEKYNIGSSNRWSGATVFWQLDKRRKVRTGKVMLYNSSSGRRMKHCNDWAHSILLKANQYSDYNLQQCLFGLHLVVSEKSNKPIAIVESEKTACVMSIYEPDYIWLACGGLGSLSLKKLNPIKNREIILYPDIDIQGEQNPFFIWSLITEKFNLLGFNLTVNDELEKIATTHHRIKKLDIADFYLDKL